ncbi:MAG: ATP-dependent Clp protease ATP-binding subunit [Patescibacteria group bacterium]|nr:ATP-dependent Clp protease ATP-binding subunit [Patescibacteria group bacterium]
MKQNSEQSFITCPTCSGSGANDKNFSCAECGGIGEGLFYRGNFLYWGLRISRGNIFLRQVKHFLDLLIDLIAFLIFIGGLGSLVFWLWQNLSAGILNKILFFWQEKSIFILFFWLGLAALMFLIYRADKMRDDEARIKEFKLIELKTYPDNWEQLRRYKKRLDISLTFRDKTLSIIEDAYSLALKLKNPEVTSLHLFSAMLKSVKISVLFARLNVSGRDLVDRLNSQLSALPATLKKEADLKIANEVKEILMQGFVEAYELKEDNTTVLNLLLPCVVSNRIVAEILLDLKIDENKIKNTIAWFRINEQQVANYRLYRKLAIFKPKTIMDRAYTAVATPLLNNFGYDLTLAAKWGRLQLCVARAKEITAVFDALKSGANGVLLTGQDGVGKKTIIEGIAREMVTEENVPDFMRDKRLIELDVARLVSGATAADAEARLLTIIDEINRAGNIILFIDNLENIIGITAGAEGSLELSEVLATQLEKGLLRCLATASDQNYSQHVEKSAIGRTMTRLKIAEPDKDQAIQILESKIGYLEARNNIFFSYNAIEAAVELSAKFIHEKSLPEKAIEILEKTAVKAAGEHKGERHICDKNDIALIINQLTEIPVQDLGEQEGEKLLNLEEEIHKYMVDQEEAVDMVANSLRRARTEMREGKRPIASFLFLGPTGVGKTELAKTISRVYFNKKDLLVRLDMSEYQEEDSIKKMIGDSDGTKGYLTEAVRQKPFSLILLDEFEKANPKIFNLFLQVMDDGRLTDGQGQTIDFTNSIVIATSNAGSNYIEDEIIKNTPIEQIKNSLINEQLSRIMRPELINRFDGIIVFKPLSEKDTVAIARLMLADVAGMLKAKGMELEISDAGLAEIARLGYDPKFGARPLRRLIQDKIEDEIAKKILGNELARRDTVVINDSAEIEVKKAREL